MRSTRGMLLAATLLAGTATTAAAAEPEWIRQFGTRGDDLGFGVATGPDGRVHVVGQTEGALGSARKGGHDAFVITFDRDGSELWRRQPGTTEFDSADAVATDADGNVYVVGDTYGALGGDYKGNRDAFVLKFDRDGRILWKRQPGTTDPDWASGVATDADGNVYVVGSTFGALGGAKRGDYDAFVLKFDRDGRYLWKRQTGTTFGESPLGIVTDADGNVYVVGWTSVALVGTKKNAEDAFVIKFDRDGRILWKRQPGIPTTDYAPTIAFAVATDADGNVYVVGDTPGALGGAHKGESDAFVIKFDRDGRYLWKRQPGTTGLDEASGVAIDADGNAYVAGQTHGALGGAYKGESDAFVIKYDRDGRILWSDQLGTTDFDAPNAVTIDVDGNVFVAGYTSGELPGYTNSGKTDAFLIKYGPNGRR